MQFVRWRSNGWVRGIVALAALAVTVSAQAEVKLPNIFGSHMVLQQGQKNRVWGTSDAGDSITVSIDKQTVTAQAAGDGKWQASLDPLPVGGPYTLTVKGKNSEAKFDDVLVGEVWICSGQSNMQWSVNQANDPDLEKAAAKFPKIRLITVPNVGTQEPQSNFNGSWQVCTPETVGGFSAVGYFFGRQLAQTLDVPIGLINNAWGGSACEAWIRRDLLTGDTYKPLMERWAAEEKNAQDPKFLAEFQEKLAAWEKAAAEAKAGNKPAPPRPQDPRARMGGNARPANIYNGALKPTIGYGIRGVIWYQGESNASRAYQYRDMFPLMIKSWRDEWGQGDFPFYWVQLADFLAESTEPMESDWAELREAQTMTQKLPNTGEAVIIDIGEGKDIHPKNKQDVGKRLARLALVDVYKVPGIIGRSPIYKSMEKQDGKIVLSFDNVAGGWRPFDVAELRGFTIAGEDRKFVKAQGKIVGDKIEVSSDQVKNPVAVRYGWANNPVVNVYSGAGLPLTPFRTDDWPGKTAEAK